ncbi:hypothetical protein [Couchioplanes caeruleus]|uniref:Uncharacterized protein n=2 Tax=Couchioplanes caeruleus TaxID=56438 RepID=A0A1K0GMH7_9ACTN|nr:hypothetical protein [Couchioplanes caeruleus]OJF10411.1 hypothetical protein BG844_32280 [Couchioplanes caeruleus subsp. caeruleus]ROP29800.1 hypothetical protein EDD30_2617 [Couchioplanes caeruleus]
MNEVSPLQRNVEIFLSEENADPEDLRVYLSRIASRIESYAARMRRYSLTIVLSAGVFALLSSGGLTEAELFGIKVQNFILFRVSIPVVMAYLLASVSLLAIRRARLRNLYHEIVKKRFPRWSESGLDLAPVDDVQFLFVYGEGLSSKRSESWGDVVMWTDLAVVFLTPVIFGIAAYVNLFLDDRVPMGYSVISLALTSALIGMAYLSVHLWADG